MTKNNKSKIPQNKNPKGKKQREEDDFNKLLSDLSKATEKSGQEKSKRQQAEERLRLEHERKHAEILGKKSQNDVEQALLLRQQQQMQVQKLLQQLMMSQRAFLDKPNTDFKSETVKSNPNFDVAVGEMQGWRSNMEDNHVINVTFPAGAADSKEALFCVFDGHSGKGCANFCSTAFPQVIKKHSKKESVCHSIDFPAAYLEIDGRIKEELKVDESGCTAVSVFVSPKEIACASVGDSRAVLCRNGAAFDLSHDHKPENEAEKERITAAGGFVQDNRVNGQLAMSRAMGDFSYKKNAALSATEQLVIPLPDVISTERNTETDKYVVLACDGIFDVLSNEDLIEFINTKKVEGLSNEKICEALCNHCLAPVSEETGQPSRAAGTDNMTVMIVDLI